MAATSIEVLEAEHDNLKAQHEELKKWVKSIADRPSWTVLWVITSLGSALGVCLSRAIWG